MFEFLDNRCLVEGYGSAKLTLTLRVLDKRSDGFNNIEALTAFCDGQRDKLRIFEADKSEPNLKVTSGDDQLEAGPSNLVNVAIEKYHAILSSKPGISNSQIGCELEKSIPVEAGLGGGSVDAALALRLMNEIYDDALNQEELYSLAAEIGSDVSACLYSKLCWMTGRGENIKPLADVNLDGLAAFLITPQIRCSTPAVYKHYDEMGRPADEGIAIPAELSGLTNSIHNDLALTAYELYPELKLFKNEIEKISSREFQLAGSGSTFFTIGNEQELRALFEPLAGKMPANRRMDIGKLT